MAELTGGVEEPLVSVGIPTYNRPRQLRAALEAIAGQTHHNLEIIVSDNASTDPEVAEVLGEFSRKDRRVRCIRQAENQGVLANFAYVLEIARGNYFMWAADDDLREPWFVERCIALLQKYPAAAATAEVQYICEGQPMPFFPQGSAFYEYISRPVDAALLHAIDNNFDNLIYSMFRRDAILLNGKCIWVDVASGAGNEIPAILYAALRGGFVVLPDIGFHKVASRATYLQARWEEDGGEIPESSRIRGYRQALSTYAYHSAAWREIRRGVDQLPIGWRSRVRIKWRALRNLHVHFLEMLLGRKPPRRQAMPVAGYGS